MSADKAQSPGGLSGTDCALAVGETWVDATIARTPQALTLTLVPTDRACVQVKAVGLLTPSGKKLKPKRTGGGPVSIGVGVGTGSGRSSASIFVSGGGAGNDPGGVYRFIRHLPDGVPGAGWVWLIDAVDGCRQQRFALRIPAERLALCQGPP